MFENVLVGVDGRPGGRDAVALATELLADTGKLTIGHVRQGELNPIHALHAEAAQPGARSFPGAARA